MSRRIVLDLTDEEELIITQLAMTANSYEPRTPAGSLALRLWDAMTASKPDPPDAGTTGLKLVEVDGVPWEAS